MKQPILIAEVGNCHFGDLNQAKQMIKEFKDAGADLVKFQAFLPEDVGNNGSMPLGFYEQCAFGFQEYLHLVDVGMFLNIPVFFSTFSMDMHKLWAYTFYHKVSAKQAVTFEFNEYSDRDSTFVSVNPDYGELPVLENARMMYAAKYLEENPDLWMIDSLSKIYKRPVGYSDHTVGIEACYRAVKDHGAPWIEKHVTLEKNFHYDGKLFRDCIHAVTPKEFEQLARLVK